MPVSLSQCHLYKQKPNQKKHIKKILEHTKSNATEEINWYYHLFQEKKLVCSSGTRTGNTTYSTSKVKQLEVLQS